MARKLNLIGPLSILLFVALVFAGAYFVRKNLLETAMSNAVELEDKTAIAELAESFPSPVNARDRHGCTPLLEAVYWGDRALVELLLRDGADVNAHIRWESPSFSSFNDFLDTPLHAAVESAQKDIVELLIANGADVNAANRVGRTPLHLAIRFGHKETIEFLIAKGANTNARDDYGRTSLHEAAQFGDKDAVELLVANGVDLAAKDSDGRTALQWATRRGYVAIAEMLRKAGAKE